MAHMQVHNIIRLDVTSTDTALLDNLEAELPADDTENIAEEYDGPMRQKPSDNEELAEGEERLYARLSFNADSAGETAADDLYATLADADLSGANAGSYIQQYLSPTGAVTSDEVQEWYEENLDSQPTDDEGEAYVPSSWDPTNHIVAEEQA